jgi:hypothetical protein
MICSGGAVVASSESSCPCWAVRTLISAGPIRRGQVSGARPLPAPAPDRGAADLSLIHPRPGRFRMDGGTRDSKTFVSQSYVLCQCASGVTFRIATREKPSRRFRGPSRWSSRRRLEGSWHPLEVARPRPRTPPAAKAGSWSVLRGWDSLGRHVGEGRLPQRIGHLLRKACPALLRRFQRDDDDTPVPGGDVRKRGREELVRDRGTQFDPNVVDAILAVAA